MPHSALMCCADVLCMQTVRLAITGEHFMLVPPWPCCWCYALCLPSRCVPTVTLASAVTQLMGTSSAMPATSMA